MAWSYTIDRLAMILDAQRPGDGTAFHRVSTDTRTLKEGDVFFALRGEQFDGNDFVQDAFEKGASAAVADARHVGGVTIEVPGALEALQRFAHYHRTQYTPRIIGITGSCGKTTSKDYIAALLGTKYRTLKTEGNLNNEIGCPLTLLRLDETVERAIIEMGANHKGEIRRLCALAKPHEGAITRIAPSHLEGFGSIDDVAEAKGELAEGVGADGIFYANMDDPRCRAIGERVPGRCIRYGAEGDVRLTECRFDEAGEMVLTIEPAGTIRLPLRAKAHAINAVLAVAVGLEHGIDEFEGPLRAACADATRFQTTSVGDITVVDDSYNANPASVAAALEALAEWPGAGKRFAALGEMLELGPDARHYHEEAGALAGQLGIDGVFARGPHAEVVAGAARRHGAGQAEAIDDHETMASAIRAAAGPGDVLLVKGSRGMKMETVIAQLRALAESAPPASAPPHP